jgi:hypothetical protein
MQRIVGGVEVEGDLRRWCRMDVEKQIDKQPLDRCGVIADLVIAGRLFPAQFQPVERRFAGQRCAIRPFCRQLAAQHRHHRIMAQLVVVDQILVAQRDPENTLSDQARHRVFDQISHPAIGETAGKALDQSDLLVGGTEQHRAGIRCHLATIERRHHFASFDRCKAEQICTTLCLHRDSPGS